MKHLLTLIQILFWIVMDITLFLFYFKWNMFLFKHGHDFKKNKYGLVVYASNYDRSVYRKMHRNKYKAALNYPPP